MSKISVSKRVSFWTQFFLTPKSIFQPNIQSLSLRHNELDYFAVYLFMIFFFLLVMLITNSLPDYGKEWDEEINIINKCFHQTELYEHNWELDVKTFTEPSDSSVLYLTSDSSSSNMIWWSLMFDTTCNENSITDHS